MVSCYHYALIRKGEKVPRSKFYDLILNQILCLESWIKVTLWDSGFFAEEEHFISKSPQMIIHGKPSYIKWLAC
jgi:hypothetical protein